MTGRMSVSHWIADFSADLAVEVLLNRFPERVNARERESAGVRERREREGREREGEGEGGRIREQEIHCDRDIYVGGRGTSELTE